MADALAQDPTKINTPIEINETIALNIAIKATISYEQVSPVAP
ncbi:MAG: hypothetical protein RL214_849 [Pseudomonadota bacterium]|jgi:hypothetical protein